MDFDTLISHCKLQIFDRAHLSDIMNMRKLCRSLNVAFKEHSMIRHSLILQINLPPEGSKDELVLGSLNKQNCEFLVETFPLIKKLEISIKFNFYKPNIIRRICYLLKEWSAELVSLKLSIHHGGTRADPKSDKSKRVFDTFSYNMVDLQQIINELPVLERLHLKLDSSYFDNHKVICDLTILGRLVEFNFYCNDVHLHQLAPSLVRYAAQNKNLKTISLNNIDGPDGIYDLPPDVTRKITTVNYRDQRYWPIESLWKVATIAPNFTSLQQLEFFAEINPQDNPSMRQVLNILAQHLPQLATLGMIVEVFDRKNGQEEEEAIEQRPLPSVTELDITLCKLTSHNNVLQYLNPGHIFANVKKAEVLLCCKRFKCRDCNLNHRRNRKDGQYGVCHNLLMKPFESCTKLTGNLSYNEVSELS